MKPIDIDGLARWFWEPDGIDRLNWTHVFAHHLSRLQWGKHVQTLARHHFYSGEALARRQP